jgi:hypothetical protein
MSSYPPAASSLRSPRAQLSHYTPAVLRSEDGLQSRGELQIVSVTGGMLSLPRPLNRGSRVSVLFLTQKGAVQGAAEMLKPISSAQQPFRFVSLDEQNRGRLKNTVQSALAQAHPEYDWVTNYRARMANAAPPRKRISRLLLAVLTFAIACLGTAIAYGVLR